MESFITHWCPTCGGVSHPATGIVYSPTFIVCGPCARQFTTWFREFTSSKGRRRGRPAFYDHVGVISARVDVLRTVQNATQA